MAHTSPAIPLSQWLRVALSVAVFVLAVFPHDSQSDVLVLLGLGLISGFSFYFLMTDKAPFSFAQMFWIFCLLFFGLIPSVQYRMHHFPWDLPVYNHYLRYANGLIIGALFAFTAVYFYGPKGKRIPMQYEVLESAFKKYCMPLFFLAACVLVVLIGPQNLWTRHATEQATRQYEQSWFLLLSGCCRAWMALVFMLSLFLFKSGKISRRFMLVLVVVMLITHFPLSINRTYLAIVWGAAVLYYGYAFFLRQRLAFRLGMTTVLLLVFPLLNQMRFINSDSPYRAKSVWQVWGDSFAGGVFDAYVNLSHFIRYVDEQGNQPRQLLGALLFFIPRKYWAEKPVGSGAFVFDYFHSGYVNVSAPLVAEGYLNFGIIGTLGFVILFALFAKRQDDWEQQWRSEKPVFSLAHLLYPLVMMYAFLLLRGDMMSGFALGSTFLLAAALLKAIVLRKKA